MYILEAFAEINLLLVAYDTEDKIENLKKLDVNIKAISNKIIEITKQEGLNFISGLGKPSHDDGLKSSTKKISKNSLELSSGLIEEIFKQLKIIQLLILKKKKQLREQIRNFNEDC